MIKRKYYLLVFVAIASSLVGYVLYLNHNYKKEHVPDPVISTKSDVEEIQHLDSLRWLTDGPEYLPFMGIESDTLRMTWRRFVDLYNMGGYSAAYNYLMQGDKYEYVFLYLRNTTAQYEFVSKIWNKCVGEKYADFKDLYFKEMEDAYSDILDITRYVVETWNEDSTISVPPHYMNLVMEFGDFILKMKDYDKASIFDEEIYFAAKSTWGHDRLASFLALSFRCQYLCRVGKEELAHHELEAFRQQAIKECSKEELEKLLPAINRAEIDMTKTDTND